MEVSHAPFFRRMHRDKGTGVRENKIRTSQSMDGRETVKRLSQASFWIACEKSKTHS